MNRNAKIVALYASGRHTMRALGKRFGLSPERIRQIVHEAGIRGKEIAEKRHPTRKCSCGQQISRRARRCVRCNLEVRSNRWSDEEILDRLREEARKRKRPLQWRDLRWTKGPGATTVVQRFGTWRNALEAAGLPANTHGRFSKKGKK